MDPSDPAPIEWSRHGRIGRGVRAGYRKAHDRATLIAASLLEPLIAMGPAAAIVIAEPLLVAPLLVVLLAAAAWTTFVRFLHGRDGRAGVADRSGS